MKIGILETGHLSETLRATYGRYPAFFERLVGPHLPEAEFFTVSVVDGEQAKSPQQADGWIITGSRSGAYDDEPWIPTLEVFLRDCLAAQVPVVGICFGHQVLAQAMGGEVVNSGKGWGVGIHDYQLSQQPAWLKNVPRDFSIPAVHQDQVVKAPKNAQIFASSDFCPIAGLVYGELDNPLAFSIQPHPEMNAEFVADLSEERLKHIVPAETMQRALDTLDKPSSSVAWGQTIAKFFRQGRP